MSIHDRVKEALATADDLATQGVAMIGLSSPEKSLAFSAAARARLDYARTIQVLAAAGLLEDSETPE